MLGLSRRRAGLNVTALESVTTARLGEVTLPEAAA